MTMKKEYDFKKGDRGAVLSVSKGKTRITIRLDDDVIAWFKKEVSDAGGGNYQSLINLSLREYIEQQTESLEDTLRKVIREELKHVS